MQKASRVLVPATRPLVDDNSNGRPSKTCGTTITPEKSIPTIQPRNDNAHTPVPAPKPVRLMVRRLSNSTYVDSQLPELHQPYSCSGDRQAAELSNSPRQCVVQSTTNASTCTPSTPIKNVNSTHSTGHAPIHISKQRMESSGKDLCSVRLPVLTRHTTPAALRREVDNKTTPICSNVGTKVFQPHGKPSIALNCQSLHDIISDMLEPERRRYSAIIPVHENLYPIQALDAPKQHIKLSRARVTLVEFIDSITEKLNASTQSLLRTIQRIKLLYL
uniref:Uncharacterized protein n=1 Tax=Otarine gammaherpesvirus 4 TaxID=2801541 RepID=A0A889IWB5_9GAMA|nr:hypothetical protein [Otarine gammaherpesvirus 4]